VLLDIIKHHQWREWMMHREMRGPNPLLSAGGGSLSLPLSLPASLHHSLSLPVLLSHAWRPSPASPSASQWVEEAAGEFRV